MIRCSSLGRTGLVASICLRFLRDTKEPRDRILQIVPSSFDKQDELVWLPNASGDYTSKSDYALARLSTQSHITDQFPWRKSVWNLNTPPKVQTFLWRSMNGALPVGSVLLTRGLHAEAKCKRCGELETPLHLFLTCPFAARIWDRIPALFKPDASTITSVSNLLISNMRMINLPPTGLGTSPIYPWLYWHLWKARNILIFEDRSWTEAELVLKIIKDVRCWEEKFYFEKMKNFFFSLNYFLFII
ncbi:hypothetical protein Bca52824_089005 [Brassica carinata]|uniref:Reverse transcriptase zinc-binding domain-containing protein n=1 Tax=Brassica carinata TaxID=52824 RepID=A0A8X7TPB9_BRACI|nr:hypothetical protein Bca52824_089005 [Brassica carinata]